MDVVDGESLQELSYVKILDEGVCGVQFRVSGTRIRCHSLPFAWHSKDVGLTIRRNVRRCGGSDGGTTEEATKGLPILVAARARVAWAKALVAKQVVT